MLVRCYAERLVVVQKHLWADCVEDDAACDARLLAGSLAAPECRLFSLLFSTAAGHLRQQSMISNRPVAVNHDH